MAALPNPSLEGEVYFAGGAAGAMGAPSAGGGTTTVVEGSGAGTTTVVSGAAGGVTTVVSFSSAAGWQAATPVRAATAKLATSSLRIMIGSFVSIDGAIRSLAPTASEAAPMGL